MPNILVPQLCLHYNIIWKCINCCFIPFLCEAIGSVLEAGYFQHRLEGGIQEVVACGDMGYSTGRFKVIDEHGAVIAKFTYVKWKIFFIMLLCFVQHKYTHVLQILYTVSRLTSVDHSQDSFDFFSYKFL